MATYYRLLDPLRQFLDANGDPYSGGKLYTYTAGTSTNKATYQDSAGASQNTNPIILSSAGRVPYEVWGTTGAYKLALYDSDDTLIDTSDNIDGINDVAAVTGTQWAASGLTPTYVSATSFTLAGDQTTEFHYGRRLLLTDSSTLYGFIKSSTYSDPNTTVTVVLDSGSLSASLSAVSYGIVSYTNTSIPVSVNQTAARGYRVTSNQTIGSDSTWTTIQLNAESYDYASAFNTSTYTYVPPSDGLYLIHGNIFTASAFVDGGLLQARIYDANSAAGIVFGASSRIGAASAPSASVSGVLELTTSAQIQLQGLVVNGGSGGTVLLGETLTFMDIARIG